MHPDEGYNALDAVRIAGGARPVFLPENNGREPLFMYLMAPAIAAFGPTIVAARLAAALCGSLMVVSQFALVRSLPSSRPLLAALAAAAITATNFWAVLQSHRALRAVLLPVWMAWMLWAWWRLIRVDGSNDRAPQRGVSVERAATVGLVGVCLAGAMWTYTAGRLLPLVIIVSAAWLTWQRRNWRALADAGAALAVAAVLMLPLVRYFAAHPDQFWQRSQQISVFNPEVGGGGPLAGALASAKAVALAFTVHGPEWWYANVAGLPIFDSLIGSAFVGGFALLAWNVTGRRGRSAQNAAFLLFAAFGVGLVPSLLTEEAPRYVRMTILWPVIFAMPALALAEAANLVDGRRRRLGTVLAAAIVVISGTAAVYTLVARYPSAEGVYRGARVSTAEYGKLIVGLGRDGPAFVTPILWRQPVVRYLTMQNPPGVFDPQFGLVLPESGSARYAFDLLEADLAGHFASQWDAEVVPLKAYAPSGLETGTMPVVTISDEGRDSIAATLQTAPNATFGAHIRLIGTDLPARADVGGVIHGTIAWLAIAPTMTDHNFFLHVTDTEGGVAAQLDGPPLGGSHTTDHWEPGTTIVQTFELAVAADALEGEARVHTGWYDWRDGARLPVADHVGDAVEVGRIRVVRP